MTNNNISFTSNIKFVKYNKAFLSSLTGDRIGYRHNEPNILKSKDFYSMDIRTCSGGGFVKPYVEAEGFHFWDDFTNKKKFPDIINKLFFYVKNPQRALLLGGKELPGNQYSLEQFQKLKKVFLERIKNVSIFEQHRHKCSETHYRYSLDTDTWTISSKFWERDGKELKAHSIDSVEDLLNCFEHVSIAEGDRLFIGKTEILPKDYPQLFRGYSKN